LLTRETAGAASGGAGFLLREYCRPRTQSRGLTAPAAWRVPRIVAAGNRADPAARPCNRTKKAGGTGGATGKIAAIQGFFGLLESVMSIARRTTLSKFLIEQQRETNNLPADLRLL